VYNQQRTQQPTSAGATTLTRDMELELMQAIEEHDDHIVLVDWLTRYPMLSDDILACVAAIRFLDAPIDALDDLDATVDVGIARGLARVTVSASVTVAQTATAIDLRAALKGAGMTKSAIAKRLDLGVDVFDKFLSGRIALVTVPQRFFAQLGQALNSSVEQARQWAEASCASGPSIQPALRRATKAITPDDRANEANVESFSVAVQKSPNMRKEARQRWSVDEV